MATLQRSLGRRACNMVALMRHLGIWPETSFTSLPMEDAIRACLACRHAGRCSRWLADPAAEPTAWQRFCPNAELFARLRRRRDAVEGLLNEPEIQRVMASDGVRREDLERLLEVLRPR